MLTKVYDIKVLQKYNGTHQIAIDLKDILHLKLRNILVKGYWEDITQLTVQHPVIVWR